MDSVFGQSSNLNVGANGPQNVFNINGPGGEYALAINDIPQRFTFGGSYELPFGRGRALLSKGKLMDVAVGGWSTNMTLVAQDGGPVPLQLDVNQNSSPLGSAVQRPNLLSGVNLCTPGSVQQRLTNYFNLAAFSPTQPGVGQFGNAPRTTGACRAPGLRTADASVFKEFQTERVHFRFQAEALNVFNTPLFALNSTSATNAPGLRLGNSQFGNVGTGTINFPRLISLGGRISF